MKTILSGLLLTSVAVAATAGDMSAKSFKNLDANADGKLSPAEVASVAGLKSDFRAADSNADGYLSQAEYRTWSSDHGSPDKPTGG